MLWLRFFGLDFVEDCVKKNQSHLTFYGVVHVIPLRFDSTSDDIVAEGTYK